VPIDAVDELEPKRQVIEADDRGKVGDAGRLGRGQRRSLGSARESGEDILGAAEVLLPDDLGFAVDALALAGVVVGMASDLLVARLAMLGHTVTPLNALVQSIRALSLYLAAI